MKLITHCFAIIALNIFCFSYQAKSQPVVINEIMYNFGFNLNALEADDWVELYNNSGAALNITNWKVKFGTDTYTIPSYTIPANSYVVVAERDSLLNINYPTVPYVGPTNFGLQNSSESIKVFDNNNVLIDEVSYADIAPWPTSADGNGMSLSLISPFLNNNSGSSWTVSGVIGGTIGYANNIICGAAPPNIVINEINYKSSISYNPGDWVELYNNEAFAVDVSGWHFLDSDLEYTIPPSTIIPANGYLVIASNLFQFNGVIGGLPNVIGSSLLGLSGDGEQLALLTDTYCLVDELKYNDSTPWPLEPDGLGPTLSLIDPNYNNTIAGSWAASAAGNANNGTPGAANNIPNPCAIAPTNLVINEINYNSATDDAGNWVEIYNPNVTTVDISNYTLNSSGDGFTVPAGTTIAPNEYIVLAENTNMLQFINNCVPNFAGPTLIGLPNNGDIITLYNDNGCLVDSVRYDDKIPWTSGADGTGFTLELLNPALDNSLANSWVASTQLNGSAGYANQQANPIICPCNATNFTYSNVPIFDGTIMKTDDWIKTAGIAVIVPGANVYFSAENYVELNAGFEMLDTSINFCIEIDPCQ